MIDVVLRFKIVGIGCGPMPIQCRTNLLSTHMNLPTSPGRRYYVALSATDHFVETDIPRSLQQSRKDRPTRPRATISTAAVRPSSPTRQTVGQNATGRIRS